MRNCPRRMVWQRTSPVSAAMRVWQDRRKLPRRCDSAGVGGVRASRPCTTSTMHSLHLPLVRQDVGTCTPRDSAMWKSEVSPAGTSVVWPLIVSFTGTSPIRLGLQLGFHFRRHLVRGARPLLLVRPLPLGQVGVGV